MQSLDFDIFRQELYFFVKELDRLKVQCDGKERTDEQTKAIDDFYSCINKWISQGLQRKELYQIVNTFINLDTLEYTDELIELESSIIGWCNPECIIRFGGEPEDEKDFVVYVRDNLWR